MSNKHNSRLDIECYTHAMNLSNLQICTRRKNITQLSAQPSPGMNCTEKGALMHKKEREETPPAVKSDTAILADPGRNQARWKATWSAVAVFLTMGISRSGTRK